VSSYGDFNTNGKSDVNATWPQRQSYLFQTIVEYGDLQVARAGEAKLNWVSELQTSAAADARQVPGLHLPLRCLRPAELRHPQRSVAVGRAHPGDQGRRRRQVGQQQRRPLQPPTKSIADIQALFSLLVAQTAGRVNASDPMTLALPPGSQVALTATNSFGKSAWMDLLKKNFPNLTVKTSYPLRHSSRQRRSAHRRQVRRQGDRRTAPSTKRCAITRSFAPSRPTSRRRRPAPGAPSSGTRWHRPDARRLKPLNP
jgi:ATPase subunit of ABC transporter with duplicated ATPase domains